MFDRDEYEAHRRSAVAARNAFMGGLISGRRRSLPTVSYAALALAAAGFLSMIALAPQTEASMLDQTGSIQTREDAKAKASQDDCKSGSQVSRFVCKNTWLGQHKFSYR